MQKLVVVFGGGVVGLQVAVYLLEAGYAVKLIAKHLPGDLNPHYPSQMAAATWGSDESVVDEETRQWYDEGYKLWEDMSSGVNEEFKDAGVTRRTYFRCWENPPPEIIERGASALWHRDVVSSFRVVPPESLPSGTEFGTTFTSFCVDAPKYLNYLQSRIVALGGIIIRATLPTDKGLAEVLEESKKIVRTAIKDVGETDDIYAYVNALGLGAMKLVGDETMFPLRSQAIYVKGEADKIADRIDDKTIFYAIPRVGSGFTVIGGFEDPGNWNEKVDPVLTTKVLELCKQLIPECLNKSGEFSVLSENVGLRPHRKGGARVELEQVKNAGGQGKIPIVHSYGHGPGGFFKSIGAGRKVVRLIDGIDSVQLPS